MSVDELPYCDKCGMSHEGEHAAGEFCPVHPDTLMFFADPDGEGVCPICDPEGARRIREGA